MTTKNNLKHILFSDEQIQQIKAKSNELQISDSDVIRISTTLFCKKEGVSK